MVNRNIDDTIESVMTPVPNITHVNGVIEKRNHILDDKMGRKRTELNTSSKYYVVNKRRRNKRFLSSSNRKVDQKESMNDLHRCQSCGMVFFHVFNLKSHFVIVHNMIREEDKHLLNIFHTSKRVSTTPCGEGLAQDSEILELKDMDLCYGRQRPVYICKFCDKPFKFEVNLETHYASVHTTDSQFISVWS